MANGLLHVMEFAFEFGGRRSFRAAVRRLPSFLRIVGGPATALKALALSVALRALNAFGALALFFLFRRPAFLFRFAGVRVFLMRRGSGRWRRILSESRADQGRRTTGNEGNDQWLHRYGDWGGVERGYYPQFQESPSASTPAFHQESPVHPGRREPFHGWNETAGYKIRISARGSLDGGACGRHGRLAYQPRGPESTGCHRRAQELITSQISEPASMALDCQPERHRRVRAIWLVGHSSLNAGDDGVRRKSLESWKQHSELFQSLKRIVRRTDHPI